jgi:hypothetical protein
VVADRFCKQPLANTGADDENSPPTHGVFKPKRENMLINYCENLPFKSDFIFARARNLKCESGENSVRKMLKNFALNTRHTAFAGRF